MPIDIDPLTGSPIIISDTSMKSTPPKLTESVVEIIHPINEQSIVVNSLNEKQEVLLKMGTIEEEFNGISNIPVNHEYWNLLKSYRSLSSASQS